MTAQQCFQRLYVAHAGAVQRYALRRMERSDADDLVAEVFAVAWRRLEDIPAEPRGWLLGVARRVAANTRRSEQRRAALYERLASEPAAGEQPPDGGSRLTPALLKLSDSDREAVTLVAWDGLTHREAAQVLGVREGTFAVRLSRARRRLARALEDSEQVEQMTTKPQEAR